MGEPASVSGAARRRIERQALARTDHDIELVAARRFERADVLPKRLGV